MLAQWIGGEVFAFLLLLARFSAMLTLMPALGETIIPARVRVGLAVILAFILLPSLAPGLPALPASLLGLIGVVLGEIAIGLFVGVILRLMTSALNLAGSVIALQSGLAAAQTFDPTQGTQSAVVARFFTVVGTVVIFAADLHLMIIKAMAYSYVLFPAGKVPLIGDASASITQVVAGSFAIGLSMAAPFLVYGIVFNIALGLLARLMPQLPVFFVAMPANIFLAFTILMFTLSAMMLVFASYFEEGVARFLG
ncbi:MAG: flagellar biosynthetic protein FliR [Pseudomonadota bacterium]